MKRVFRMIGEGEDNITAFDFDTYMIKKDAVCIFKPCKDFTIKVTWREGSHVMKALADADGGFRADGRWYAREGYEKFGEDVSPYRDCEIELGQGDQDGTETARGNWK